MGSYLLAATAAILPLLHPVQAAPTPSSGSIQWFSCPQNETAEVPYECGTLEVPLDYTNTSSGTLELSMVRVNHTNEPFLGTILFNFGGPGFSARGSVVDAADSLLETTGGNFNLIGHDPRGTGDTIPYICYTELDPLYAPISSHPDASDVAAGAIFTDRYVFAEACRQGQAEYGELVGTAFTARDMIQIVDALGEDGLLRFWGFSYGSALGATAAAMFPDRVERIVLDGVLNLRQYYEGLDYEQPARADDALRDFLEACMEASEACALSQHADTADELESKIYDLFESIREQPLALGPTYSDVVRYDVLKTNVVTGLRVPTSLWLVLDQMLDSVFAGNATRWQEANTILGGLFDPERVSWPERGLEGAAGIRCSDSSFRTDNLADFEPILDTYMNISRLAGALLAASGPMTCAQWPFEAKERIEWTGGYETRHPLLFVGNSYDQLTPLDSAFNSSADFPGSAVLSQRSGGHASRNHPSVCTARAIRDYFVNGTLPEAGLVCEPDEPLGAFGLLDPTLSKRAAMSEEDARLSLAMEKIAKRMVGPRLFNF